MPNGPTLLATPSSFRMDHSYCVAQFSGGSEGSKQKTEERETLFRVGPLLVTIAHEVTVRCFVSVPTLCLLELVYVPLVVIACLPACNSKHQRKALAPSDHPATASPAPAPTGTEHLPAPTNSPTTAARCPQ